MYIRSFLLLAIIIGMFKQTAQCQPGDTTGKYKLVWADEFNNEGPVDPQQWKFEQGFVRNHEAQWYQPQNAVCHNGMLVISAEKVRLPNPGYQQGSTDWKKSRQFIEYTSSSLNTGGLHSWRYGRFIMRGRFDTDAGLWPAFWTLGTKGEWPSNGEIDIMEYYRDMLLANIACGTDKPLKAKWFSTTKQLSTFNDPGWSKKFHVWRMDWDEQKISLYVDDLLLNQVNLKDLVNTDGSQINPFNQPHYILLNMAIGGDNGGDPASTVLPKKYEIDYVRVYQ